MDRARNREGRDHAVAVFVSPHGFGHAARTVAVLHQAAAKVATLRVELFTLVPEWFFRSALPSNVQLSYYELETDVGFVQRTAVEEDLAATVERLAGIYPVSMLRVTDLARRLERLAVQAVVCDISAVGILAAEKAGLPSVLVENFTWDWIYSPYVASEPRLAPVVEYLAPLYERASLRIQTVPVCRPASSVAAVGPIARRVRRGRREIRAALSVSEDETMVLMSMGGVPGQYPFIRELGRLSGVHFVLAGVDAVSECPANVHTVPHQSPFFHPDLVAAADAIVGKVGYSTVAEAYHGRTQFFYVPRPVFPESAVMERFVRETLNGVEVPLEAYRTGEWLRLLESQLNRVRGTAELPNGDREAAEKILGV